MPAPAASHTAPVPARVREQAQRAQQLHDQIYAKGGDNGAPVPPVPPADDQAPPNPADAQAAQQPPADAAASSVPGGEVSPAAPSAADALAPPAPQDVAENWEHKYKTMQGMFNSAQQKAQREREEFRTQIQQLNQLVQQLQGQIQSLRAQPPATPAPAAPPKPSRHLKPEEIADYGPDMIDVMQRAAREVVEAEVAPVRAENQRLTQRLQNNDQYMDQLAFDRMCGFLTGELPNWQEMNTDPEFVGWLAQNDPFSGQPRQTMLNSAVAERNGPRVLAFFKGYIDQTAAVQHQAAPGTGQQQQRQPQVRMESMVAPGRPKSTTGQSAQQSNGRVWTRADIQRFYADRQRGVYRGREAESQRIEQDIIAAGVEGRVR